MDKEEAIWQSRILELAERSYGQNVFTFTNFLTLSQIDMCLSLENQIGRDRMTFFGGMKDCDRRILRFGNPDELGYDEDFPITCLVIEPLSEKFAGELTHRDYLGALMNLGLERETLGDIFIQGKKAYLFCLSRIASYITEELRQAGKNPVKASVAEKVSEQLHREVREENLLASSARIDGIVAKLHHLSRSNSLELFRGRKIYVNSRLCENNSYPLKPGDVVSVRGYGKFRFKGVAYETKKGKYSYRIGRYC